MKLTGYYAKLAAVIGPALAEDRLKRARERLVANEKPYFWLGAEA